MNQDLQQSSKRVSHKLRLAISAVLLTLGGIVSALLANGIPIDSGSGYSQGLAGLSAIFLVLGLALTWFVVIVLLLVLLTARTHRGLKWRLFGVFIVALGCGVFALFWD